MGAILFLMGLSHDRASGAAGGSWVAIAVAAIAALVSAYAARAQHRAEQRRK